MAIIIPHEGHLRHELQQQASNGNGSPYSLAHKSLPDLCRDATVLALVLKQCNAVGKKNGFKQAEILQAVILTPDEWTPESGLVTAAQKIQRSKIAKTFEAEIKVRVFPTGALLYSVSHRFLPTESVQELDGNHSDW